MPLWSSIFTFCNHKDFGKVFINKEEKIRFHESSLLCLYQNEKQIELVFELKETGELIGGGGIGFDPHKDLWVIGYNLRSEFWGKGFTVEALSKMIDYAKEKYGAKKIEGTFAVDNIGSRRVMEKLGMSFDYDTYYSKFDGSVTFKAQAYSKVLE